MKDVKILQASSKDRKQLLGFFRHYKIKRLIQNRVNCYLSHNFTIIAKDKEKIVGVLQWYIKENPAAGVVEFEELYVSENYRGKGIGSLIVKYAIQSAKNYFAKIDIKLRRIFLFIDKENKIARDIDEKHGFKFISELGDLFSDTGVELFYCLNLH